MDGPTMTFKLPDNVRPVKDRHGRTRYRFRKAGYKSAYIQGKPGTKEFYASLADAMDGKQAPKPVESTKPPAPRSLDDLYRRMKQTPAWRKKAATTRRQQSLVYDRFLNRVSKGGKRYGERPASAVTVGWLETIFGEMDDRPGAADDLRKKMIVLMQHAVKLGWAEANTARLTTAYGPQGEFHTWTEAEIAQYRAKHPLGTMARLTLELALNTAARRCNVAELTRDDIRDGRIVTQHAKDGNEASVPLMSTTRAALEALPAAPIRHLVVNNYGRPFSVGGLGNKMRKWCDQAGLPQCSMHGLRKALARRVAETGSTDAEGQAVTGHKKAETFIGYRKKAERSTMADKAIERIEALELSNLHPRGICPTSKRGGNSGD